MTVLSIDVKTVARSILAASAQCRHCNGTANLEYIREGLTGAQVCPGRYVTRTITYGEHVDPDEFKTFVQEVTKGMGTVEDRDIRVARRYAWDLGIDRKTNDLILMEVYWTQNYRRTKNDNPNRPALFLCSNRDSFFVQPLNENESACPNCREKEVKEP